MKKNIKNLLTLTLAVLMVFSLVACKQAASTTEPAPTVASIPTEVPPTTAPSKTEAPPTIAPTEAEPTSPPEPEAKIKDTIYVAYGTEHTTLNPILSNNADTNQVFYNVYSLLWKVSPDGSLVNDLVDTWSVSDDMLAWTITLKEGLKFSDGSDLTTQDVYDSFNKALNHPESPMGEELWFISSMEIMDDLTLIIHGDDPYPALRNVLASNVGVIVSSEALAFPDEEVNVNPDSFAFSGPYKITEWVQNKQLVLERNEYYYGEPAITDRIVLYPIPEASSRGAALETSEVDIANMIQAEQVAILKTMPDDFKIHLAASPFSRVFRFGLNDPIMSNKNVRLAIMWAIDAKAINEALFPGLYRMSTSGMIPGCLGYENLGEHYQDLDKARELLAEAGYPNGFKTVINTTTRYPKGVEIAEALSEQLKAVGIEAEVKVWEWPSLIETWSGQTAESFDEPMFIMGAGCDTLDGDTAFNRLYVTSADGTNTGTNYGLYSNPEVDELVAAAAISTDNEFRIEAYRRVSQILYWEDPAQIFINDGVVAYGIVANLAGFWTDPVGKIHLEGAFIPVDG